MCVLSNSFGNNDFQINKCAIILQMDERMSILNITYLRYAIIILERYYFLNIYISQKRENYLPAPALYGVPVPLFLESF